MNVYKCDRCGKYFDKKSRREYQINREMLKSVSGISGMEYESVDLCNDCYNDFMNWFEEVRVSKKLAKKITEGKLS